ncbi:intradiol ring-cleavage dioxygenase [Pseudonocardia parietis]|uniref:Protocatechuate 3,4-dioxygenase beta subunit n=1 Tax=Pseudonocardia parietis TaxID=570936 RepID=A0ABS4W1E1_9PSEU|nr:intradiol ring-cleavage dioxygenase [Pseudonocardia parietis]MBP2370019.1 protocatechuate 3,4-dioxygenase beta subunit [Pseudonocardia parietis]
MKEPRYEGRALPRPDEDVVDQGLGFDVGTLLNRRRMLSVLGAGTLGAVLVACGGPSGATSTTSPGEIPDETAGPYPGDGSNGPHVLEQSGVVRSDIRSSTGTGHATAQGVPMTLELRITDMARAPMAGAAVYVWHCDREGRYSMYSEGVEDENYLRGVQVADGTGTVRFTSIVPACYPGRWPHVHVEVYPDEAGITDAGNAIATSQVALPEDLCHAVYATTGYEESVHHLSGITLDSDNVFGDDGGALQVATVTGDVRSGYTAALAVAVDTTT